MPDNRKNSQAQPVEAGGASQNRAAQPKLTFVAPKLTFVVPKLVKHGDVSDVTAGFFGTFYPD
jgi:hypothetical protein